MGGLRRSELTALTWTDFEDQVEGIVVHVRRSKTNQDGSGPDTRFVKNRSARAIRELGKLRAEPCTANDDDSVFGLSPDAVGDRIQGDANPRWHRLPRRSRPQPSPRSCD